MENHYLRDVKRLLRLAGQLCSRATDGDVLLAALTYFALGCERALKAMLWQINPAYTLIDSDFKNSAAALARTLWRRELLPSDAGIRNVDTHESTLFSA